jgi:putative PIG3 family NAD(P)H quinone oxidoreductase
MTHAAVPRDMRAVAISEPGPSANLRPVRRPVPQPGPGEVLIRVAAAGVNRPDCLQRRGQYPPPPGVSDLPGLEVAGTVAGLGDGAGELDLGDPVCALLAGGGYAEYCVAPAVQCLPVPAGLDMVSAAALPETVFTVWTNLFERGRLAAGETVLIHGGASGIGTTAIQLARAFGARVFATVGSDAKRVLCEELGAERAVNYRTDDFAQVIRDCTGRHGVDVILDIVGASYLDTNLRLLAPDGRLVVIGVLGGAKAEINLARMLTGRLTVTASTLRARSPAEKGRIARALRDNVWPKLAAGDVRPVIQATFPLDEAWRAHEILEANQAMGKLVLTIA